MLHAINPFKCAISKDVTSKYMCLGVQAATTVHVVYMMFPLS